MRTMLATVLFLLAGAADGLAAEVEAATPFGLGLADADQPISIRADELEAISSGGERRLVFTTNVTVDQADVHIESRRLEAFYPKGQSQPERLVADGDVRLRQKLVEARCDHATYERTQRFLVCRGHAELRDGDNRVRGAVIEFDLEREVVRVKGGVSVLLQSSTQSTPTAGPQSGMPDARNWAAQ